MPHTRNIVQFLCVLYFTTLNLCFHVSWIISGLQVLSSSFLVFSSSANPALKESKVQTSSTLFHSLVFFFLHLCSLEWTKPSAAISKHLHWWKNLAENFILVWGLHASIIRHPFALLLPAKLANCKPQAALQVSSSFDFLFLWKN